MGKWWMPREKFIEFFSSSVFVFVSMDDGDGCVGKASWCVFSFLVATKKRHTFFTLFNAISVSNVFCSCLVVHERGQINVGTRETRNLSKFQTTNGTWVCRCQWKIMHSHFVVVRIDEHDESRSTLEWSIRVLELVARTKSIATRSCVNGDKEIENVRIFLSHLFPFVRLFAFVDLCIGPFDYLQCIKCVTKESPRVPRDHWECCTKC